MRRANELSPSSQDLPLFVRSKLVRRSAPCSPGLTWSGRQGDPISLASERADHLHRALPQFFRSLETPPRGTWRPPEARLGLVVYSGWSPYGVLWQPLGYIRDTILGDLGHVFLSPRPYPGSQTTV